ncbi:MAG: response regulator [Candidatus Binataceae bacterium]
MPLPDNQAIRVLLIEDNPADARLVRTALEESHRARFDVKAVSRLDAALDHLRQDKFDVVVLDLSLPDCPRDETLTRITTAAARVPIVVLTGMDDESFAREIVKRGAQDYLVKGEFEPRLLSRALAYAIERKNTEEDLARARDAAQEAVGLRSAFLANMSHEIRTPMNAIIGTMRMLMDTALDPEQREFAGVVWSSAHSLLNIVNDILDFSKVSAGKLHLHEAQFSPTENLERVAELFSAQVQKLGIGFATFVDDAVPANLRGDPGRLQQVLVNLVGNAIKFVEAGEVSVTLECVSTSETEVLLRWSIRDTGPGIALEVQPLLFNAFYQADASSTRRHGGTGLGLAISAEIVARMGGEIGLESVPGHGANFWFTASFKRQAEPSDAPGVRPGALLRGHCVLLAAAENLEARFLVRQLESWGVKCERATTAEQALARISEEPPEVHIDAILIDCDIAEMTELALARQISARIGDAKTPILGICRLGRRPDAALMRSAGMVSALVKPVRQSELSSWLNTAFARGCVQDHQQTDSSAEPPRTPIQLKSFREIADSFPSEARARALILVAEDNTVNCKMVLKMLERLGCRAESVTNGREALEALAHTAFNIVLMDCQMPEMDGYEATREIRRRIGGADKIAVIGLTAHALDDDRQKCIDAGMDDYLSKPFLTEELAAILSRWIPRCGTGPQLESASLPAETRSRELTPISEMPAIDPAALLNLESAADDGPEFVRQLITLFVSDLGLRVAEMRSGVTNGAAVAIAHAAHTLKGSCGHFGAKRLLALCRELEAQARAGACGAPAAAIIDSIEHECVRVRRELDTRLVAEQPRRAD